MKKICALTLIASFSFILASEIQAQTDLQAEKLIKALQAEDCANSNIISQTVKIVDYENNDAYSNNKGYSLLFYGTIYNCYDVVKTLLEKGARADLQNASGNTALIAASSEGFTEIVNLLLEKGADANLKNRDGLTALIIASSKGHKEVVTLLLSKGANVDLQSNIGTTALFMASLNGQTEVVKLLLEKGADPDLKTTDGRKALDLAANEEIITLLTSNPKK